MNLLEIVALSGFHCQISTPPLSVNLGSVAYLFVLAGR